MARDDSSNDAEAKQRTEEHKSPGAPENKIPIVDLARLDGPECQSVREQIAEACQTWGFFHVINHGVDASLIKRMKDVTAEFFHCSEEVKSKVNIQPPIFFGWKHPKLMSEGNSMIKKDTAEHLALCVYPEKPITESQIPQHPASFRSTLYEYSNELRILGSRLLDILSEMLGLEASALTAALTAGSASQSLGVLNRSNYYELRENGEALQGVCHAHSDSGGLTILLADEAPGLEVRKDGQWVDVNLIPGGLIVNVGDMVEVCSNGRYRSVEHRGLPSPKQERITIATFQGPEMDAVVGPIGSLLDENHPPLYKTSTFGAYIAAFVKTGMDGKGKLERLKL